MTLGRRAAGLLLGATTTATLVLLPAPASAAPRTAPSSACTASAGTVVAVDFAHWHGPVVRGCDTGSPKTGAQLLDDTGFTLAGTVRDGPSFVCRIGNGAFADGRQYPTSSQDPCVTTPPASAYWSYWLAQPGTNTWGYSQTGAYADRPKPGEVELWIFGGTRLASGSGKPQDGFPVCSPNSLRAGGAATACTPAATPAPQPTTAHPTARSTAPRSTAPAPGEQGTSSVTPGTAPRPPRTSAAVVGAPTMSSSNARTPTSPSETGPDASDVSTRPGAPAASGPAGTVPPVVAARPAADPHGGGGGSAAGLTIGLVLVLLLLGAGGWALVRRRRMSG